MRAGLYHTRFSFLFARVRGGCQQEPVFGHQRSQSPTRLRRRIPGTKMSGERDREGPPAGTHIRSDQYLTPVCVCARQGQSVKGEEAGRRDTATSTPTPTTSAKRNGNIHQRPPQQQQQQTAEESNSKLKAQGGDYSLLHVQQPWLAWPALMLVSVRCSETMGPEFSLGWKRGGRRLCDGDGDETALEM